MQLLFHQNGICLSKSGSETEEGAAVLCSMRVISLGECSSLALFRKF